ncbi:lysophospholipid acyltransferase family protein [Clostridium guangxiense]|uniref:lysophospholipid acyltransferase family protein n=2 Tax=Clostridium TaxID=1485 RepID=UPI001E3D602B|nr:lysophospholipid acyltransferase family protein [Clostridium guangxiense]MCD2346445.1 1-acyl-sn-glycerol-3-phosphate acyltransferase [Clostridium guangxiense]
MKTIFLYVYFGIYIVITLFFQIRLAYVKRYKGEDEYEKLVHKIVMSWSRNILKTVGVKVNIKGLENIPDGTCVFVSNHQGNFDFLVILANIDKHIGFLAKKEILKLRIVSSWMKKMHCVFINRSDVRDSLKAINQGVENIKNGYSMVIFPEGTRSKASELGEFKKGALKLATKTDVPIVPIVLDRTYKIFEEGNGKLKSGTVEMSILKPINISEMDRKQRADLSEMLRNKINDELKVIKQ